MTRPDRTVDLFKLICEVRYEQALLFEDIRILNNIGKRMKDHVLPFSQKNADGSLACIDPATKTVLIVRPQSSSLTMDDPQDIKRFASKASSVLPEVLAQLEVDTCVRIGVRAQWILKYDSVETATADILAAGLSPKFQDAFSNAKTTGITLTLSNEGTVWTNVGVRAESYQIMEIVNNITKQSETVTGIVIDIDVYDQITRIRPDQINGFVKNVEQKVQIKLDTVLRLLG